MNSDVTIVGAGLTGLTAALHLADGGRHVTIIEKALRPGGNSIKASSGINGVPTMFQPVKGDSVNLFIQDTLKSGKNLCNTQLVEILAKESSDAIYWLIDQGINLSTVSQLGGHSMPRTHRGNSKVAPGYAIISKLLEHVQNSPNIDIQVESQLKRIIMKNQKVAAIEYTHDGTTHTLTTSDLILASGGYAADTEMDESLVRKYRPDLVDLPTTNADSVRGDGQKIAVRDCQVQLLDMTEIQINPTGFVDFANVDLRNKILCGELLRGIGGILVSPITSKRFVDELQTRDIVSDAVFKNCKIPEGDFTKAQKYVSIIIIDPEDYHKAQSHINFYVSKNLLYFGTLEELTQKVHTFSTTFDEDELIQTLKSYNKGVGSEGQDEFGRKVFGEPFLSSKFYYGFTTPSLHFSMGGIAINENGQALNQANSIITNLYAVGEIAAGVHGKNRLGGNSLLECTVFGKRAAMNILSDE
ncbi:Osmotic growth protein 1 [Yamadazyma tenuis]|uniref:Fumarate reductase n=1 Tax=Candida tenuis (strain ATCC 10573 / BCRC 21748 / CBS 615 / JCM 9827 / NBRC 10315 / NRRL Y-1498 / VKM Y-70) TaxID=590646 RepID=G3BBZ6_CANTC|nr:Flavocytochrome c [Yamadazyma tenuis ATCC 10573]XP_006690228.1 uncharacterized protein CANTEDRAFT_116138 [Yamadazyma tenuis ATCC 10573]EGV61013.1 Flavocytochrome c [Yamadazyma tenuis ATCC 10573]EGV61014.1 hypothetical protein CANTEDRAFT_116138 [Yamadazyma tenuis ATCC 10573]WEJ94647.1 Osmotic growth protein 1 [Yamadazyma tenuis]